MQDDNLTAAVNAIKDAGNEQGKRAGGQRRGADSGVGD